MNTKSSNGPQPKCVLQGAFLTLTEVQLKLGPFTLSTHPGLGFGHSVDVSTVDGVPVTTLRSAQRTLTVAEGDLPTSQIALGYDQNGAPDQAIAFTVTTDSQGGLQGCSFSLEVASNYPDVEMAIPKYTIDRAGFTLQNSKKLPQDYVAQLKFNFWADKPDALPLDAWAAIQVGFLSRSATLDAALAAGDVSREKLTNFYELLYYPASGLSATAPVLGHNYPAANRFKHQLIDA